jgi:hypothetical protein
MGVVSTMAVSPFQRHIHDGVGPSCGRGRRGGSRLLGIGALKRGRDGVARGDLFVDA